MPEVQQTGIRVRTTSAPRDDDPVWVRRMRAKGYDIRRGTLEGQMPEVPEAFFYPPPSLHERLVRRLTNAFRRVFRPNAPVRADHASLP